MALADDYLNTAIQWKINNAAAEKSNAEAKINALANLAQAASARGEIYIQVLNSGATIATYNAITTRWGKKYLESLGFRIEALSTHANIWWGYPDQVEAQVEAIVNPPPISAPTMLSEVSPEKK